LVDEFEKAKIISATQAQKIKCPQLQAQIKLLHSEEDNIIDEAVSAELNAAEGTEMELSNTKYD
jgi:hypothetical protein